MGITAVKSHAKGAKHSLKQYPRVESVHHFIPSRTQSQESASSQVPQESTSSLAPEEPMSQETIEGSCTGSCVCCVKGKGKHSFVKKEATMKAEILWCMKTVQANFSFHSNQSIKDLFSRMFPDSALVETMTIAETKSMYLAVFGVAPHVRKLIEKSVKDENSYVMMFEESFNREMKKKQ